MSVYGEVCVVCPLLVICGKTFFCLILSEEESTVPVLVTLPECVHWRQCVYVGQSVCVSALRVCSFRGLSGKRVLSVTTESRLLSTNSKTRRESEDMDTHSGTHSDTHSDTHLETHSGTHSDTHLETHSETHSGIHPGTHLDTHSDTNTDTHSDTHMDTTLWQDPECDKAQVHYGPARTKISKIISYKGRITKVQDVEAGLYEVDGKMLLCLAYQPMRKWGGGLRPGAEIELHNIHFLFRPSLHAPDVVLCACLQSTVSVTNFSPLRSEVTLQKSESSLVRLLLEQNLDVCEYLWLCYCHAALAQRLCPQWVCEARVSVVSERLLKVILGDRERNKNKRDIYKEMLQDTHTCPLTQYRVSTPSVSLYSVKELCDWLEKECWACLLLSSLLPSSACHMTRAQLNALLAWSVHTHILPHTHTPADTHPPADTHTVVQTDIVLVGVLEPSVNRATVRLVDQTGSIDCVCVQSSTSHLCVSIDTAWMGCLVCVRRCTLLMERFMKTDFPSWKHLEQYKYITHKHCRVYICVSVDDLHILSPSAAMSSLIQVREHERGMERGKKRIRKEDEEKKEEQQDKKKSSLPHNPPESVPAPAERREAAAEGDGGMEVDECVAGPSRTSWRSATEWTSAKSCVSLLLHVQSKTGVAFRNVQSTNQALALTLSFVVKATRLGDVQVWDRDPKNCRVEEREMTGGGITMELQFVDSAVRWFSLLQPGTVYRLIAHHTRDVGVLSCSCVPVRGGVSLLSNPTLLIQAKWRIHTLSPSLLLSQPEFQGVMSVSEVLHASSANVVSFYGMISERITLQDETSKTRSVQSLISTKDNAMERGLRVRLTLHDVKAPHNTLHVYMDFSQSPYTPGLVTGATIHLHHFQRKVSVVSNVYCWSLPISSVTVTGLRPVNPCPPPPIMHLGVWASAGAEHGIMGQVQGHVVCVLCLWLQWTCSLCGCIFRQAACTRRCPPCDSTSAVFQAEAKVAVEDGTGEAQVRCPTETLANLLLLGKSQWEVLQRRVRVKGHVRIYARGRRMVCDVDPDNPLVLYLCHLCSSSTVCRNITFTCKRRSQKPEKPKLRKVRRGDREFLTKFPKPLQLQCTHIHTLT